MFEELHWAVDGVFVFSQFDGDSGVYLFIALEIELVLVNLGETIYIILRYFE